MGIKNCFLLIRNFLLEILFPSFCLGCGKEGSYLCEDCVALIGILEYQFCPVCGKRTLDGKTCPACRNKTKLNGLYFAVPYHHPLIKQLISRYKYQPFAKDLSHSLTSLIIAHFAILDKTVNVEEFKLTAVPLYRKRLKWRGFNQAEEITKLLSEHFGAPLIKNALVRTRQTVPQTQIENPERREENIKGAFVCQKPQLIKKEKILLIDDVYTTGATMNECARVLKDAGAKEIWGVVVARG